MKKFIFLLMISSVLIIQCSNESETYQRDIKSTEEAAIDEQSDYFSYEFEEETNIIKVETKRKRNEKN